MLKDILEEVKTKDILPKSMVKGLEKLGINPDHLTIEKVQDVVHLTTNFTRMTDEEKELWDRLTGRFRFKLESALGLDDYEHSFSTGKVSIVGL